ncbi:MAG: D-alanyl-D-alanine carboxypeptidase/D-alanyl-D-alanine-endopeptidase, partial [Succinivibrionaceae bacterium]|nr:D-alanyl-D-alanine carboxypeptidase/D-alanyl-D-alanine-endopeptidase [Succinivibrionaceae bacterium]
MGKKALLTLSLCATLATCAPAALAIPASPTPTPGSQVAVAYRLPGQAKVEGMNLDTYYHPASTQKLLTAVAALLVMGPDYTMETSLALAQGASGPDASGTVHGDLVLRFSGDPSLSAKQFLGLFEALRKAKVKSITGRLILDVSRFGGLSRGQGWSWSDLPACFTAPASPVIIDRNCAFAELTTHGEGEPVTPAIPAGIPVSITADAVGIKASQYGRDCEMETNLYQGNAYHVQGCVPIVRNKRTWPLSLAVSDPLRWGRDWAARALSRLKITATGGIALSHEPVPVSTALASHRSKPLAHLVRYMLVHSNNLYADSIAKNLTYEYLGKTATYTRM